MVLLHRGYLAVVAQACVGVVMVSAAGVPRGVQELRIVWGGLCMCRCACLSTQSALGGTGFPEAPAVRPAGFDVDVGCQDCWVHWGVDRAVKISVKIKACWRSSMVCGK